MVLPVGISIRAEALMYRAALDASMVASIDARLRLMSCLASARSIRTLNYSIFLVLPVGIEPTLQAPQACVLSIERRKQIVVYSIKF